MYAMFVIPTLVSDSIHEKLIPSLSKLIERNVALAYKEVIYDAVMELEEAKQESTLTEASVDDISQKIDEIDRKIQAYESKKNTLETTKNISSGNVKTKLNSVIRLIDNKISKLENEKKKLESQLKSVNAKEKMKLDTISKQQDIDLKNKEIEDKLGVKITTPDRAPFRADVDQMEVPKGINMYSTIGLEPTYLEFRHNDRDIYVGFKCAPFKMEDVDSVVNVIKYHQSMKKLSGMIKRTVIKFWYGLRKKLPFTRARHIERGRQDPKILDPLSWVFSSGEPGKLSKQDILFSPNYDVIRDPLKLAKFIRKYPVQTWAAVTVLSIDDFENTEDDLMDIFKNYKKLAGLGWGDILVMDPTKEVLNYCTLGMMSCNRIDYNYLGKVIHLPNTIDYDDSKRLSKPFSTNPRSIL